MGSQDTARAGAAFYQIPYPRKLSTSGVDVNLANKRKACPLGVYRKTTKGKQTAADEGVFQTSSKFAPAAQERSAPVPPLSSIYASASNPKNDGKRFVGLELGILGPRLLARFGLRVCCLRSRL